MTERNEERRVISINILGSWSLETDDWCFKSIDGCVSDYKKGGTYCYNYYGISYWTDKDSEKLKADWVELHDGLDGKDLFWEFHAFIHRKDKFLEMVLLQTTYPGLVSILYYTIFIMRFENWASIKEKQ